MFLDPPRAGTLSRLASYGCFYKLEILETRGLLFGVYIRDPAVETPK